MNGSEKEMKFKRALDSIVIGERRDVVCVGMTGEVRRRFFDLGFSVGERVRCVGSSPLGDPIMLAVGGKVIAVRRRDLAKIYTE